MATQGTPSSPAPDDSPAPQGHRALSSGGSSDETLEGTLDGGRPMPPRTRTAGSLPLGFTVGRYVVTSKLGQGGMGVVYAARDPELDRKVAIKLMRAKGGPQRIARGHRRLLAEAQALARLNDPHVVAVHDVGEHAGQVFVAMEFVEGHTLSAWLRRSDRSWSEVLDVLLQAGRGMVAAHARELVHCDFKPDNVMVGDDGRVRVMDFGLAQAAEGTMSEDDVDSATSSPLDPADARTQGLVGTPAYMAPEQLSGGRGTMISDQFSFCVTAWEALFGCRPFVGETLAELVSKILAGELGEPTQGRRVPGWLRRIVERGMAVDPRRRWRSMDALLAALERGRARARRRKILVVLGLAGAAVAGALVWQHLERAQRVRACEAEGATITEVWNDDTAAGLRQALSSTGVGYAEVTADKAISLLDAHAQQWQAVRAEACQHAEVEGSWDVDLRERSSWCLDERRRELEALVARLERIDAPGVVKVVGAAAGLDRLEPCLDATVLSGRPLPPQEGRAELAALHAERYRAAALRDTGAYDEALEVSRAALQRAEASGWPPLTAELRVSVGQTQIRRGEYDEAEALLEQAFFDAARADALETAVAAAGQLAKVVGVQLARARDGLRWAQLQALMARRLSDPSGLVHASVLESQALVRQAMGEYTEALALYEQVVELEERALGSEHLGFIDTLANLATVLHDMGDYERAKEINVRGLALREQALGPEHPEVGMSANNLARDFRALGASEEAKALYERALAIWEASLGPEHPFVAQALNNLANANADLGALDQTLALHRRALAIRERVLGPDHPDVAQSLENLGTTLMMRDELDDAAASLERALQIRERTQGSDSLGITIGLIAIGNLEVIRGRYEQARAYFERAERILTAINPDHPMRGYVFGGLADVALGQGRMSDALSMGQQAHRLHTEHAGHPRSLAWAEFVTAQAQWATGGDRAQARAMALRAREVIREHEPERVVDVDRWLGEHAGE